MRWNPVVQALAWAALVSPALPAAELDAWLRRNGGRVGFWTAS